MSMNGSMDRIVIKYAEAEQEFATMMQAAQELEENAKNMVTEAESASDSWRGTDADAYLESVKQYSGKLTMQAQGLQEFVNLLKSQAVESYYKEMEDARQAAKLGGYNLHSNNLYSNGLYSIK